MSLDVVDGFDRGIGIRIGGKQRPFGVWIEFYRLLKQFHAIHFGHAMIHKQQGHSVVPLLQPAQQVERGAAGLRTQDAVMLLVVLLQIAFDGAEHFRIVIHCQYDWLLHSQVKLICYLMFRAVGRSS